MGTDKTNELVNSQIKQVEGVLFAVMKSLHKLAPNPEKPNHNGALFIQTDSSFEPPAEYEGMLGSLLIEGGLGSAFASASSGIGWDNIIDGISEFIQDRAPAQPYRIGTRRAISNSFNTQSSNPTLMAAYLRDLPRRLGMERWVADYQRKFYALQKRAALGLAA